MRLLTILSHNVTQREVDILLAFVVGAALWNPLVDGAKAIARWVRAWARHQFRRGFQRFQRRRSGWRKLGLRVPPAVMTDLECQASCEGKTVEDVTRDLAWRGFYFTIRAGDGWTIVFERQTPDGVVREVLQWPDVVKAGR